MGLTGKNGDSAFRLNYGGLGSIMRSRGMAGVVTAAANKVAAALVNDEAGGVQQVFVDNYTTDRAASAVTIVDPRALDNEIMYGTLSRAARAAGLEVNAEAPK